MDAAGQSVAGGALMLQISCCVVREIEAWSRLIWSWSPVLFTELSSDICSGADSVAFAGCAQAEKCERQKFPPRMDGTLVKSVFQSATEGIGYK